jgi:hypothetical protein
MSRRKDPTKPKRAYHAFPWTTKAKQIVEALAFPLCRKCKENVVEAGKPCSHCGADVTAPAISLRTIAAELVGRGVVDQPPSAAAIRRLVISIRRQAVQQGALS